MGRPGTPIPPAPFRRRATAVCPSFFLEPGQAMTETKDLASKSTARRRGALSDTPEARAFLQHRLAVLSKWLFLICAGGYVLGSGMMLRSAQLSWAHWMRGPSAWAQLGTVA